VSWQRLRTLLRREARASLRDPFTVGILVAVPLLAMVLFGFVLSTEVHGLRLAVLDGDASPASRRLIGDLRATGAFTLVPVRSRDEIELGLVDGRLGGAIVVPPGFGRDLAEGRTPEVNAIYDAAEAVLAGNAEGYVRGVVAATGARLAVRRPASGGGIAVVTSVLFNPTLAGVPFMVSGTFGFVLSFLAVLITAVTIVNERMAGTFEQLQVTPATTLEILLGKLLPMGGVFALDIALMMLAAGLLLGVWPNGSAAFFWIVSALYVLTTLSMGLIFSATSATAAEAVQKTVIFSIPIVQLSGFAFPIRNMPGWLQWVTECFPATHYIRISRAIYLRGEGPLDLWPELLILAAFGALQVTVALRTMGART